MRKVKPTGVLSYDRLAINIGACFAAARVRILEQGELINVYHDDELVRTLALQRTRRYQRLGRRRGEEVEIRP